MKHTKFLLVFMLAIFLTSCGTYQSSSGGGFFGGATSLIDYGISQWEKYIPADSYDHTLIDAWKSGTGGKALAISEIAVGTLGGISGKDVSKLQERIHNAADSLTNNETFGKSDVNNWVGALFTLGDEFIDEYNQQKFDDAIAKLTDPNASGYNEEEAIRVKSIDYANRKIIWKSNSEYIYDLIDYRKSKNENWISSNLHSVCGISLEEYNNLPNDARQDVDMKILAYDKLKESSKREKPSTNELESSIEHPDSTTQTVIDYASLINGIVISEYSINSFSLSEVQKDALDKIAEILNDDETTYLLISGHTCSLGSEKVNYILGLKRANTAKDYLMGAGIDGQRISIESLGFSKPINDNSTETERKHNRRLTFKIFNQ